MSTHYWLCREGCQFYDDNYYRQAFKGNEVFGTIGSFSSLNKQLELGDNDAFCMYAVHKYDLGNDIYSIKFKLIPARTAVQPGQLYLWGHHDGLNDLYFLAAVTGNSALHLNATARPGTWSQKGGPYAAVDSQSIKAVADQMT